MGFLQSGLRDLTPVAKTLCSQAVSELSECTPYANKLLPAIIYVLKPISTPSAIPFRPSCFRENVNYTGDKVFQTLPKDAPSRRRCLIINYNNYSSRLIRYFRTPVWPNGCSACLQQMRNAIKMYQEKLRLSAAQVVTMPTV